METFREKAERLRALASGRQRVFPRKEMPPGEESIVEFSTGRGYSVMVTRKLPTLEHPFTQYTIKHWEWCGPDRAKGDKPVYLTAGSLTDLAAAIGTAIDMELAAGDASGVPPAGGAR